MASKRSALLSDGRRAMGNGAQGPAGVRRHGHRWRLWLGGLIAILVLAWFDGGEEPIRPIIVEIPLPEAG